MLKLFISVYDRPEYLKQSLNSLFESFDLIYPEIIISDDGSKKPETQVILSDFSNKFYFGRVNICKYDHKGLPFGKLKPIKDHILTNYYEDYFLISDSDMIYKKGWIDVLVKLYEETKTPVITGFNTITNKHRVLEEANNFVVKESVGGCNLLIDTQFYKNYPFVEEKEWDYKMCERAHQLHPLGVISSKPSVVDHIGVQEDNLNDKAIDFNE
jgi:glycosyltransferase involved in cell wall biosynthesis